MKQLMNECVKVTLAEYQETIECFCGKKSFKIYNSSKNERYAKCAYFKEEYDLKTKKWIQSKKQPCKFMIIYSGERPIFQEIQNKPIKVFEKPVDPHLFLEKRLTELFRYLFLENRNTTLQEIDMIVIHQLKREPRKTFYYPTIGLWLKIAHREEYRDYHDRIFSKKIIDLSLIKSKIKSKNIEVSHFIDVSDDESIGGDNDQDDGSEDNSSHYESEVDEIIDEPDFIPDDETDDDVTELGDTENDNEQFDDFENTYDDQDESDYEEYD